jgi:hypothetical protein
LGPQDIEGSTPTETSAKRLSCSADFPAFACGFGAVASKRSGDGQVCCVADFQICGSPAMAASCRLGSRRHSRFGNLRYAVLQRSGLREIGSALTL